MKKNKLLVLGATAFISEIVKEARKKGYYVIVTDYNETAPAKELADESLVIDVKNTDEIIDFINKNHIDGVLTGFTDSLFNFYYEICQRTNLPCCINKPQIDISTNKILFKQLCKKFGIRVINEYHVNDKLSFPVIIKPVDNSGARGIHVCRNDEQFKEGLKDSLLFSPLKKVIVEDYLNLREATVFYLFIKGKAHLIAMGDRHVKTIREGFLKLPTGYTFPSVALDNFIKNDHEKFLKLFDYLQCQNGMVFIQGFVDENDFFIPYECGFRLTGSLEYKLIEHICGYNPLSMMIDYAVCGDMLKNISKLNINPYFDKKLYNLSCLSKPGTIKNIIGIDKLKAHPNIIDCFVGYQINDTLTDAVWGKLAQILVRVFFEATNQSDYDKVSVFIKNSLQVIDTKGEEMLLNKEIFK